MKRLWPLVVLGVGAFLLFALATFPASIVLSRLDSLGVATGGVSGSVWNGRAQVLQVRGVNVGSVEWKLHLLPLLTAHAQADVKVTRTDGFANARISIGPTGALDIKALTASLPLSVLPPNVIPGGWTGTLNAKFTQLTLQQGWPTKVDGLLDVVDVVGPAQKPAKLGDFRMSFDPAETNAELLQGKLSDAGQGPLQITGTLRLKPDRSYELDTLLATRPDAPRNLVKALEYFGPPDAEGRRPFSAAGTL